MAGSTREYTGDWRALGMLRAPRTEQEGFLVIGARNCINALKCFDKVRQQLIDGRSASEVARYIFEEAKEGGGFTRGTMTKYVRMYRMFFIPAAEIVRPASRAAQEWKAAEERKVAESEGKVAESAATVVHKSRKTTMLAKVLELSRGLKEVGKLETAIGQQADRIAKALKLEGDMGGLMLPSLWREYETLMKLCQASQTMKSDLGFPGYQRVPRLLDMRFMPPPESGRGWGQLTEGERDKLLEFAQEMDRVFDVAASEIEGTKVPLE